MQIVDTRDYLIPVPNDDIALQQTRAIRRTTRFHARDQYARLHYQAMKADHAPGDVHILAGQAQIATPDFSVLDEPAGDELRCVDADGETNALGRANDRGIDTHHLAIRRHERSAGISWIETRIGLNDIFDQPTRTGTERPAERTDHAGRDSRLKPIGIAYRHHQ